MGNTDQLPVTPANKCWSRTGLYSVRNIKGFNDKSVHQYDYASLFIVHLAYHRYLQTNMYLIRTVEMLYPNRFAETAP